MFFNIEDSLLKVYLTFCVRKNNFWTKLRLNVCEYVALEEAAKRFQELKAQRETKEALEQERNSRRPPPYKLIKVSRAFSLFF